MKRLLTIAGSDSGGGAGIAADLRTFAAYECYGMAVVTAVTAQDARRVYGWWPVPPEVVRAQLRAVLGDADAVKVGMLGTAEVASVVAEELAQVVVPIVVDPVVVASSGDALLSGDALEVLRDRVIPLATVVTPNRDEAALLGELRAQHVVVTGSETAVDVLDGERLVGEVVAGEHTHGTGCTFASAVAARLAYGDGVRDAVVSAKGFVARAIARGWGGSVRQV